MHGNNNTNRTTKVTSKLIDNLGFELRTLLNGFQGPIQLLKHRVQDPHLVDIFRLIDSSLVRLENLSVRSSIAATLAQQSLKINIEKINIIDTVRYCALNLQTLTDLENITINIPDNPASIMIDGDNDLLIQVFEILLETATSLSVQESSIDIGFYTENNTVGCKVIAPSASLPNELGEFDENRGEGNDISWNLLLAREILSMHNAQIYIRGDAKPNFFMITFKQQ